MAYRQLNKAVPSARCRYGSALLLFLLLCLPPSGALAQRLSEEERYSSEEDFVGSHLGEDASRKSDTLWLTGDLKQRAADILGHRYAGLRVRYWGEGNRTVWILDEIGKEMPITIGVAVDGGAVADVKILEYRESRGGEVRYPFFTRQFKGLSLDNEDRNRLNGNIDGITGATLSVAAVRKIAILALVFHQHTPYSAS